MKVTRSRGARRFPLRTVVALGCAIAVFLTAAAVAELQAGRLMEPSFLAVEIHTSVQRRRQLVSPGDLLVDGLAISTLALLIVGIATDLDGRLSLALWLAYLHFRLFPLARRQAYVACDTLKELQNAISALNRLNGWLAGLTLLLVLGLLTSDKSLAGCPVAGLLSVRPRTLSDVALCSSRRDGVVEQYRIRTAHTDTHWVLQIRQPLTLRIPRDDPDFADIQMVALHQATGDDGGRFLPQRTVGELFRLSRQMTNVRIGLYKRRERIEDVLSRSRHKHALTPRVENAIHQMLLVDPLLGPTPIRQRLVEQALLTHSRDISLKTINRAIQTVDYLAVRQRLQEMIGRGKLVPDYQKLCQMLLLEMTALAEATGTKLGEHLIPVAQLINSQQSQPAGAPPIPARPAQLPIEPLLGPPGLDGLAIPPGSRASFFWYFTCGASYREVATFLGVCASTVYRRLASIRRQLPSLQRLLGPVRYSGIVAVDEKYILAPKPHREGKMGRWVYLFAAIDPYTYDLLHAQVYPARTTDSARAFLLSLKAQGVLTPKVLVTDLWGPYETVIPEVYPGAIHHQCVFHAEQAASTLMRDKLGADWRSVPPAEALRRAIVHVFRAGCRRTLIRRYTKLLQQKQALLADCPELTAVFDSLARHFEKVANAYADRRLSIPRTNNAVERVFRTFTRRYKTMTGFDRLETAQAYVQLWAYYYRFRPFSPDANQRIRNRSPLQIAGYAVQEATCLELVRPPPQLEARC